MHIFQYLGSSRLFFVYCYDLFDNAILKVKKKTVVPWQALPSPVSVVNKTIEENRWEYPEVPMEEDWKGKNGFAGN